MAEKEDDFLKRLLSTFRVEADEHLKVMDSVLLELEKAPAGEKQSDLVEAVFREAHSLKGAARAVNVSEIETLCQAMEDLFAVWKRKEIVPSTRLFDTLQEGVTMVRKLLSLSASGQRVSALGVNHLAQRLEEAARGTVNVEQSSAMTDGLPAVPEAELNVETRRLPSPSAETVRISAEKLKAALFQAEELLSAKLTTSQRSAELREIKNNLAAWKKEWIKIQPGLQTIQRSVQGKNQSADRERIARLSESLDAHGSAIASLETKLASLLKSAEQDRRNVGKMVDDLLGEMKRLSMLPFSSILEPIPRLVRELAREQGKEAELSIRGSEIEIDRRILEEIKDALIHLVRNCVDHGIEGPEGRLAKNKPRQGTITIAVAQRNGSKVEVWISDDGAGIDIKKVKAAALKAGLLALEKADAQSVEESLPLIFESGVSTTPIITDISGRGLGLAIVREKVEKLGGSVSVETDPAVGTSFRLLLPLTLSTFRGTLIRLGDRTFVVPTANVERVMRVRKEDIKTAENIPTIHLNGRALSLVRLEDVLELPAKAPPQDGSGAVRVLVLSAAGQRIAFLVDEILHELEVLVKSLGKQLTRVRNVAGATVLGSGQVVPILNVPDLMKSAVRAGGLATRAQPALLESQRVRKSILVVEDSITARTLLKNILEAAGYDVKTAVDGVDAFTELRAGEFDVVVSDVDMPRMNGFDLTVKIRADKKLAEKPVILVTALESREDRERGIDVGASAYIVKSSFDQSNLLEVIRRLI